MDTAAIATLIRCLEADVGRDRVASTRSRSALRRTLRRPRAVIRDSAWPPGPPAARLDAGRLLCGRDDCRSRRQRDAARTLTGAGILAALPSAATGFSDWVDTADAERRVGFLHLGANIAAVGLYAFSWVARRLGKELAGGLLGAAGGGVMTMAGWLGGHLAFAVVVGVDTTAFEIARPGDAPRRRSAADGIALAVFEDGLGIRRVLTDRCRHRGGRLSDGDIADGCVTCPWHGSRFDIGDGHFVQGPASHPQPVYEVRVSAEGTEVRRDEPRSLRRNPVRGSDSPSGLQ